MKVCVVGAGAIGGYLGVRIAEQGHDVSLIARGPHLAAIRENGLTLRQNGEETRVRDVFATDNMTECGPQDVVLLALKAHQIVPVIDELKTLFGPDTVMVALQNGIPWWYFQGNGDAFRVDTVCQYATRIDCLYGAILELTTVTLKVPPGNTVL